MITKILLKDQTTGKNILWANAEYGAKEIQLEDVEKILPRWQKLREHQKQRTRDRAEIFTPPDICKLQNDLIYSDEKTFEGYIDAKFLEITCGEAPYLVNRYNAVTGEPIEFEERFGLLDRKLKLIKKEKSAPADFMYCTRRAVQSVYGYDFQGDNLFLARQNVFKTVEEFLMGKIPSRELKIFLIEIAEIISWNLWQMDGLTCSPPFQENKNLFGGANCLIMNWTTEKPVEFITLTKGARR